MLKLFAALNLRHFFTCLICSLMLISVGVAAHEYETQAFVMEHPFANPSQPGQTLVPVYLRFLKINDNDRLISAECRYANSVELRGSQDLNSPPISAINISVGDNFEITPNTPHILLKEISIPFNYLSHYDLKLHFEKSGMIEVTVSVGM